MRTKWILPHCREVRRANYSVSWPSGIALRRAAGPVLRLRVDIASRRRGLVPEPLHQLSQRAPALSGQTAPVCRKS